MPRIYLDHNASTPLRPEVLEAMLPYLSGRAGNPSSLHTWGREGRAAVEGARASVAAALGCSAAEVCFTGGGTEAINWALKGVARGRWRGRRIVTTQIEHRAVLRVCAELERQGCEVVRVGVDAQGIVDPEEVRRAVHEGTLLISAMHANNETGSMQPVRAIGELAWERGVPFHVDAVQTFGKLPVRVDEVCADLVSISGHKINGPQGVGALYVRGGMDLEPLIHGGGQEGGRRGGTENVAGIVGLGRAVEICAAQAAVLPRPVRALRDRLEQGLLAGLDGVQRNGHPEWRLDNTANLSFRGVDSRDLVLGLDLCGIAAASGSACAAQEPGPSHVLLAMGAGPQRASSAVRFSLGWGNTPKEVEEALERIVEVVERLRRRPGL
ncbi:MAG: cysteine desulfurase family protein [Candidatus Latescibacterota bacterium]